MGFFWRASGSELQSSMGQFWRFVDLSKAYDTVRHDLLEHLLVGSGLPPEVRRPMLDMTRPQGG